MHCVHRFLLWKTGGAFLYWFRALPHRSTAGRQTPFRSLHPLCSPRKLPKYWEDFEFPLTVQFGIKANYLEGPWDLPSVIAAYTQDCYQDKVCRCLKKLFLVFIEILESSPQIGKGNLVSWALVLFFLIFPFSYTFHHSFSFHTKTSAQICTILR